LVCAEDEVETIRGLLQGATVSGRRKGDLAWALNLILNLNLCPGARLRLFSCLVCAEDEVETIRDLLQGATVSGRRLGGLAMTSTLSSTSTFALGLG